jgi:hypothetical protein
LKLQKTNNFQNWKNAGRSVGEKGVMIYGAGVLGYSILEEDDFGSAILRLHASRY